VCPASNRIDIFVQPGEYFVGDEKYRIRTLLGSCVSIVLWHPIKQVGALSHFLLSSRSAQSPPELDARYGDDAMWLMLRDLKRLNVTTTECHGKIFGGGNMFPQQVRSGTANVGERNGETGRSWLRAHGIRIVSESLFGVGHRQIIFDVKSGHVWARQVELIDAHQSELRRTA
jgi:chemotaxis protein CheD